MNLHEYQSKQLFADYGLPVSPGFACDTPEEGLNKKSDILASVDHAFDAINKASL
mgnify:CR=1 FL=1